MSWVRTFLAFLWDFVVGDDPAIALAVVSVFDHLWWTQPPAQLLASVVLANWARASRTRIP